MPVTRSVSATRSVDSSQRGGTLALRIQFKGYNGQKVLRTSQDDVQSLVPWLKSILTTLHLPHPKPSNVIKNIDTSSIIEMFWDHAESTDALEANVINRLKKMEGSTLQQMSIDHLMIFVLPLNTREVPSWKNPVMGLLCPFDNSPSVGTSSSNLAPTELEEGLLKIFERIGVSIPTPVENYAIFIPILSKYLEMLHNAVDSETAARKNAEEALAEERARHARILQDIETECREPFIVPALLDAFVAVSQVVDSISDPQAG
ncbi:hypothetical protein BGY98DRAFT_999644 [Russula aff. rugulosa BPL654]|nr:hypothetical protein BGY98DRAFT_999644 [Russula aff. rugulosa BPL654]